MYAFFVDFRKAYDSIIREHLWTKLSYYGVSRKLIEYMREIYRDVNACIKTDSHSITDLFSTHIGLRQGDVTSSINFLFFLNDLADYLLERGAEGLEIGHLYLLILLYADDLCIFDKTARGLQMKINIFATYCEKWGLIVNIDKSKIMFFRKSLNQRVNFTWKLNGEILRV